MQIYDKIKELCDERNLPIYELERQAGIGNAVIRKWNEASPNLASLLKVAKVLGVKLEDLVA